VNKGSSRKSLLISSLLVGGMLAVPSESFSEITETDIPTHVVPANIDHTVVGYHIRQMSRKIRMNLNPVLCPSNLELVLEVRLTENGDLSDVPKFVKRSNNFDCDEAVLTAIYAAKPFAMPIDHPKELKLMREPMLMNLKPHG
jgi:colicin import membrane protein